MYIYRLLFSYFLVGGRCIVSAFPLYNKISCPDCLHTYAIRHPKGLLDLVCGFFLVAILYCCVYDEGKFTLSLARSCWSAPSLPRSELHSLVYVRIYWVFSIDQYDLVFDAIIIDITKCMCERFWFKRFTCWPNKSKYNE